MVSEDGMLDINPSLSKKAQAIGEAHQEYKSNQVMDTQNYDGMYRSNSSIECRNGAGGSMLGIHCGQYLSQR